MPTHKEIKSVHVAVFPPTVHPTVLLETRESARQSTEACPFNATETMSVWPHEEQDPERWDGMS